MQNIVDANEAKFKIPNLKEFYREMRFGLKWHLPNYGCSLLTMKWLEQVRYGKVFCLKIGRYDANAPMKHMIPTTCPRKSSI